MEKGMEKGRVGAGAEPVCRPRCARARERERERQGGRERKRERETAR